MDHKKTGPQELARLTEIPVDRWKNIRCGRVRASTEELDACTALWSEYAYWLITGNTLPEAGQISPEIEETRKNLNAAG
jgi:hypothetical protein